MSIPQSLLENRSRWTAEPSRPLLGQVGNGFPGAKESADIDAVALDSTKAHISIWGQVHLEIFAHGEIQGMNLQSDPSPPLLLDDRLATRGAYPTFPCAKLLSGLKVEASTVGHQMICEKLVQPMA